MATRTCNDNFVRGAIVRRAVSIGVVAIGLLAASVYSIAQAARALDAADYPSRPVRIVIPYAPGGTSDAVARVLEPKLSAALGHSLVIDNRGGASGIVGREMVAKAAPDGYTLLFGDSTHAISPHVMRHIPYHAVNDFDTITLVATTPQAVVVNASFPGQTLKELIARAKSQPGALNYGSGGSGSVTHLTGELFKLAAGVNITHVPYKSIGIAITDLIGNQIQAAFPSLPGVVPHARSGRLRVLAVSSAKRTTALPEAATFEESGVSMVVVNWIGMLGPAGMPRNVVARLHDETVKAVRSNDVEEKFAALSLDAAATTPEAFKAMLKSEFDRWGKVVKQANVKPDQ